MLCLCYDAWSVNTDEIKNREEIRMRNTELKGDRCSRCNGSGTVVANTGFFHAEVNCPDCRGTGVINSSNACKKCKGSGSVVINTGGLSIEATCDNCSGTGLE